MFHGVEVFDVVFVVLEKVDFIYYDYGGDAIGLGRSEEPIDECGGGCRVGESYHEADLVDIRGQDMRLLAKITRTADYVVPSGIN